jgi:hypothetical protein
MSYDNFDDTRRASESLRRSRAATAAKKKRRKKLLIRRTIIVLVGLLIVFLAVFLIVQLGKAIFGGGSSSAGEPDVVQSTVGDPNADPSAASEAASKPAYDVLSFKTPNIKDDGTTTGAFSNTNGGVYMYKGVACELFGWYDSTAKDYAKAISEFKEFAPEYKVYNIVVPNHTEFTLPSRVADEVGTMAQWENIKAIYSQYTADVQPINIYNTLCDHIDEYIYFNTDHHWSGLGAYYAYAAFCDQTGQTPLKLSDCEENTIEGFQGTLYDESQQNGLDTVHWWQFPYETHAMRQDNPGEDLYRTTVFYEEEPGGLYSYGVFIWGDAPLFVCHNDEIDNGKKIALVKESYGNAFAPFLTANYEEVHVVDFRYFEGSLKSYMQDNDIDEVIFLNNVMSANTAVQVDRIRDIF